MKILSLLTLLLFASTATYADSFAVSKNIQEVSVSTSDIKSIFLGKRSLWDNKQPILLCLVNQNEKDLDSFLRQFVGKNTRSYNRFWTKRLFSGESSAIPEKFASKEKAFKYLENRENVICYIGKGAAIVPDSVSLLEIK